MLFHWLDGIKHFAPDRYKQLQAPTLKSFYERAVLCPGIAKRLHERKERFTNKAPGSASTQQAASTEQHTQTYSSRVWLIQCLLLVLHAL